MEKDNINNGVFLKVHISLFTSGIAARLGKYLTTLLAIASYMDEKGECYPTQRQLAERTGTTKNLINRHIKALLDFEVDGKPILTRRIVYNNRGYANSIYTIHPISQVSIFHGEVAAVQKQS